jgi:citrate lyase subunit beta/citryl-CoA lyase
MSVPASYLYVPGDAEKRLRGASARGAHALIADLEDAVSPDRKDLARRIVAAWLAAGGGEEPRADHVIARDSVKNWVRVNPGEPGLEDIEAVWGPRLHGVCLAKAESASGVAKAAQLLEKLEGPNPVRRVVLMPLIESATALRALREIASAPRVGILHLGEIDLATDLSIEPDDDGTELLCARSKLVVESRASRIAAPVGGIHSRLGDPGGLGRTTRQLRRLGFGARAVIHPEQIETVNAVFAPTRDELVAAKELVRRYEESSRLGQGVYRDEGGRMVDEAVARSARTLLDQHENRVVE